MNIERWSALLRGLEVAFEDDTFSQLQSEYAQKHRRYHTARHIAECLSVFDGVKDLAEHPPEVECALWFHDAIYRPMSRSNEERSANWMAKFGISVGMAPEKISRISTCIMATRHLAPSRGGDCGLVVDIDLAILGATQSRYDEFERDVRTEYRWVPKSIYNPKRVAILKSFLGRPRIYHWQPMFDRFERNARMNVTRAIHALSGVSVSAST